jgi:hypothetical protein
VFVVIVVLVLLGLLFGGYRKGSRISAPYDNCVSTVCATTP